MSKGFAFLTVATWSLGFAVLFATGATLQDDTRGSQEGAQDPQAARSQDNDQQGILSRLPKGCSMVDNMTVTCTAADAAAVPNFINGISPDLDGFIFKYAMGSHASGRVDLKHATFPPMSALTSLEISTSNLEGIQTTTLQHLTKLKFLNLKNNHIRTLEPDIFYSCRRTLEVLDLSNNDIELLHENIFSALKVLEHIDLRHNRLRSFDAPFTSPVMNSVSLGGNPLQTAAISSKSKTYTCDLDLSFTEISVFRASMFSNIVCTASDKFQLSLKGDHITEVDIDLFKGFNKDFGKIDASGIKWQLTNRSSLVDFMLALTDQSMDYLDFSDSYLTHEEVRYFMLLQKTKHLGTLDISGNIIGSTSKSWPIHFEHLSISTMRTLNISANGNKGLMFDTMMPGLEVLDLSQNIIPIDQHSVSFSIGDTGNSSVPALRVLKMTSAFQTSSGDMVIPSSKHNITWFEGLGKLEELYLDNNYKLFEASPDFHLATMFRGLHSLRNLSLASTSFGRRGFREEELDNLFDDLKDTLIYLDLRDNHISHRYLVILKGLKNLKVLDLRSNDIGYLVGEWYTTSLEQLYIADNSLLVISYSTMGEALNNNLQFMSIADNPYSCSCELAGFTAWLKTNASPNPTRRGKVHVPDMHYAMCMIPENMEETPILGYQPVAFSCNQLGIIILGVFAAVLFLFLIAMVVSLITKSTDIQFYFRTRKGHRVASSGVFMGYCEGYRGENFCDNSEQAWVHRCIPDRVEFNSDLPVHIKFMQPVKENDDTTLLGRQIVDQHEQLRFILLVMGPLFIQHYSNDVVSTVCANGNVMERCKNKFVLVLINGLKKKDLPAGMAPLKRCATCYEWPDSKRARNIFWKKLLMKLSNKHPLCC